MTLISSFYIVLAFICYYLVFQVFSNFIRSGMVHNTPNRIISGLRTEYGITIKTFQKNNSLHGFAWFKSIYLNENLFRNRKKMLFVFHHEHYHLMNKHKQKVLLMRLGLSVEPLLLSILTIWLFLIVLLASALLIYYIQQKFEKKANEHAKKMIEQ